MSDAPSKIVGCSTCTVTVDHTGQSFHEPSCVTEQLKKHRNALQKIGHILKEVGIDTAETAANIFAQSIELGGDR